VSEVTRRTVAFVFPGQGSQRTGMLDSVPRVEGFDSLLAQAERLSGLPLGKLAAEGPAEALADTRAAQPLLFLADWAWAVALRDAGVVPDVVAGHSLGELASLVFAGSFSVPDGLALVCERSRLMAAAAAAAPGTMAAVLGMDGDTIAASVEGIAGVWVANDNAAGQVVISGTHDGIERATRALSEAGARKVVPLQVAGPFHSPLMAPAATAFAAVVESSAFDDAAVPVVQNTGPSPATDAGSLRNRLVRQISSPVRWRETMETFQHMGIGVIIEAGPGAVLTGLARRIEGIEAISAEGVGIAGVVEAVGA
jgi:[acyl-carrier-protein] S-malonyltransferase